MTLLEYGIGAISEQKSNFCRLRIVGLSRRPDQPDHKQRAGSKLPADYPVWTGSTYENCTAIYAILRVAMAAPPQSFNLPARRAVQPSKSSASRMVCRAAHGHQHWRRQPGRRAVHGACKVNSAAGRYSAIKRYQAQPGCAHAGASPQGRHSGRGVAGHHAQALPARHGRQHVCAVIEPAKAGMRSRTRAWEKARSAMRAGVRPNGQGRRMKPASLDGLRHT